MSRRAALSAAALATLAMVGCSGGGAGGAAEGDMALGAPEGAKVTVVEYASVTCGVCAAWQRDVWPAFKAKYVDTNQVRYVFRELPTPPQTVATAGFLLARCAGEDNYFRVIEELMLDQPSLIRDPRTTLFRVGGAVGLSQTQVEQCIADEGAIEAADARFRQASQAGVTGTPTFFVNGATVMGSGASGVTLEDLSTVIDAELAKG